MTSNVENLIPPGARISPQSTNPTNAVSGVCQGVGSRNWIVPDSWRRRVVRLGGRLISNTYILYFLAVVLGGWVNRRQQSAIDYLMDEKRGFRQQLPGRRLQLADNDRRRMAAKAKALGRDALEEVANLVTLNTLLAWCRHLFARKWPYPQEEPSRPTASLRRGHRMGAPHGTRESRVGSRSPSGRTGLSRSPGIVEHVRQYAETP